MGLGSPKATLEEGALRGGTWIIGVLKLGTKLPGRQGRGGWGSCRTGVSSDAGRLLPETAAVGGWLPTPSHCAVSSFLLGTLPGTPGPGLPPVLGKAEAPRRIGHPCNPSRGSHPTAPPGVRSKPDTPGQRGRPSKAKVDLHSLCSQPHLLLARLLSSRHTPPSWNPGAKNGVIRVLQKLVQL